jgi:trimeric autotransporter adhesin
MVGDIGEAGGIMTRMESFMLPTTVGVSRDRSVQVTTIDRSSSTVVPLQTGCPGFQTRPLSCSIAVQFVSLLLGVLWVASLWVSQSQAVAQCQPAQWLPGDGVPGTNGDVNASTLWDPDGPGPRTPVIAIGGYFGAAGNVAANNVAAYDPATGQYFSLGNGVVGRVYALTALPNGDLIAGGEISRAGGVAVSGVARWNDSTKTWSALGSGISGTLNPIVFSLCALSNGDFVAGGRFTTADGRVTNHIARWDSLTGAWAAMGQGMAGPDSLTAVYALTTVPNGDVVAGGYFSSAGGVPSANIARWSNSSKKWSPMGSGLTDQYLPYRGRVSALVTLSGGDVVAGGEFRNSGSTLVTNIARWTNASANWSPLAVGISVLALAKMPNGDLIAGGPDGVNLNASRVTRWNGTTWEQLGSGMNNTVRTLAVIPNGDLFVGGGFTKVGALDAQSIAIWKSPGAWYRTGSGLNAGIRTLALLTTGDVVAGGDFTITSGGSAAQIARWSPSAGGTGIWSPLGSGLNGQIFALTSMTDGGVVAGGQFDRAGGVSVQNVARWRPQGTWSSLGTGIYGNVFALTTMLNGDVVAGGVGYSSTGAYANHIARFDSSTGVWTALGTGVNGVPDATAIYALTTLRNGDVVAGGAFNTAGGRAAGSIARWNGSAWFPMGAGMSSGPGIFRTSVRSLVTMPNGDLVAGGNFEFAGGVSANYIARWNGTSWRAMGTGLNSAAQALAVMPNGDLVAGGWFTVAGGARAQYLARWSEANQQWIPLEQNLNSGAVALAARPNGELVVGGFFSSAGEKASASFARYTFGNATRLLAQPASVEICRAGIVTMAVIADGGGPLLYQWQIESMPDVWSAITAEPVSLPCGVTVWATSPTSARTDVFITPCPGILSHRVRCVVTNSCGVVHSDPASIVLRNCPYDSCPADYDGSGGTPDSEDIEAFFADWLGGANCADLDCSEGTPDSEDIQTFIAAWLAGTC